MPPSHHGSGVIYLFLEVLPATWAGSQLVWQGVACDQEALQHKTDLRKSG